MHKPTQTPSEKAELRSFGLVFGGMVAFVFGLALPWLFGRPFPAWPWVAAAVLVMLALLLPAALRPVSAAWMVVGHWLGWVNTRIILGIVFYTVFFIAGQAMRLAGKDPMARKIDKMAKSYRVPSRPRPADHVERPF